MKTVDTNNLVPIREYAYSVGATYEVVYQRIRRKTFPHTIIGNRIYVDKRTKWEKPRTGLQGKPYVNEAINEAYIRGFREGAKTMARVFFKDLEMEILGEDFDTYWERKMEETNGETEE